MKDQNGSFFQQNCGKQQDRRLQKRIIKELKSLEIIKFGNQLLAVPKSDARKDPLSSIILCFSIFINRFCAHLLCLNFSTINLVRLLINNSRG